MAALNWTSHFSDLARYNIWATERLSSAVTVMDDLDYHRDVSLFFKSVHGTLNHLLVGEHMLWFPRFSEGVSPKVALDTQVHSDRAVLAQALKEGALRWVDVIESWPYERWNGVLSYTTMRGMPANLPFAATLAHVFNHATHHRGQITAALTHLGYESPELDMVYWLQGQAAISE
jgi:uncharacterized damage-inducible protein DinB